MDINQCMWPYFDTTLLLRIVDFYLETRSYDQAYLLNEKLSILSSTMLATEILSTAKALHKNDQPYLAELHKKSEKKASLENALQRVLSFVQSEEMIKMLKEEKLFNMSYIGANFSFDESQLNRLFDYAKCLYDSGDYNTTLSLLHFYRRLSHNKMKNISALWGQLNGYILLNLPDKAFETFVKLKDNIDSLSPSLYQRHSRVWLIHCSLFLFFKCLKKVDGFNKLIWEHNYGWLMQRECKHLFRHLLASLLLEKNANILKAAKKLVKQNRYVDAFVDFAKVLTITFDFDRIHSVLLALKECCAQDFFLCDKIEDIMLEAKRLFIKVYAKANMVIQVETIAKNTDLSFAQARDVIQAAVEDNHMLCSFQLEQKIIVVKGSMNISMTERCQKLKARADTFTNSLSDKSPT